MKDHDPEIIADLLELAVEVAEEERPGGMLATTARHLLTNAASCIRKLNEKKK